MIISEIFSLTRLWAVIVKEFIQMWRDKGTFAMMVLLPIIQLCIFGYAINSDPKSLPAGLIVNDTSRFSRTIIKSLETSDYFKFTHLISSEEEALRLLQIGEVQFVVNVPENFAR